MTAAIDIWKPNRPLSVGAVWSRRLGNAREKRGLVVSRGLTSVHDRRFDAEFRRRFRLALKSYPTGHVALRLGVSKDIVKHWKAGSRDPSAPNLLSLASMDKSGRIAALVIERLGEEGEFDSERTIHERNIARQRELDRRS